MNPKFYKIPELGEFGVHCFEYVSNLFTSVSDPDPDPYQEALIWIRAAPKINQNHGINKSKWFVDVFFKIIFNNKYSL